MFRQHFKLFSVGKLVEVPSFLILLAVVIEFHFLVTNQLVYWACHLKPPFHPDYMASLSFLGHCFIEVTDGKINQKHF